MARILVIDDDPALRRLLSRTLSEAGHDVFEAADGKVGVQQFRAQAPDVVITDIIMPEKEGIETIVEIRAVNPKVGILAITGGGSPKGDLYLDIAARMGADRVLAKPFWPAELVAAVDELLNRKP